jgi:UDP-N-acetylmuramoyl-tripeptide--D-alanyl-D-alanine ligase
MNPMTLHAVRDAVLGELSVSKSDNPLLHRVCTNSRDMEPDSLFIALKGDNFDGHRFLAEASAGGAVAALVDMHPNPPIPGLITVQVDYTRLAMGRLAAACRRQLGGKVIAVAGSNGKTSTKHLIDAALHGHLNGTFSPKSFNNDIGVPLAIFPADPQQDYLVLEIGTNHHGEIRVLSEMATPDIAVITNCGADHLEFLGSLDGVRRENATIIAGLNPAGALIVNGDDPDLLSAVKSYPGRQITFGFSRTNDLFATDIHCTATGTRFRMNDYGPQVFVPMLGRHSASNALAAIAVAREMGVPEATMLATLSTATGPDMRLQWQAVGAMRLLNDAYNANPDSMRAAIETAASIPCESRRIAILGDMKELGATGEKYHREIGRAVATSGAFALLFCVGSHADWIAEGARANGLAGEAIHIFPDTAAASASVPQLLRPDDMVLLKASRGMHLETIVSAIAKPAA